MTIWRTRIDPEATTAFGEPELHIAAFQHQDDRGGICPAVMVQIPETPPELFVKAMVQANTLKARIAFVCDTARQAEDAAARAAAMLPRHRRISYSRVVAGAWGTAA